MFAGVALQAGVGAVTGLPHHLVRVCTAASSNSSRTSRVRIHPEPTSPPAGEARLTQLHSIGWVVLRRASRIRRVAALRCHLQSTPDRQASPIA